MKNKKSQGMHWEQIAIVLIILVVIVVVIVMFSKYIRSEGGSINKSIADTSNDCDGDGVPNLIDRCFTETDKDKVNILGCGPNDKNPSSCPKT